MGDSQALYFSSALDEDVFFRREAHGDMVESAERTLAGAFPSEPPGLARIHGFAGIVLGLQLERDNRNCLGFAIRKGQYCDAS